MRDGQRPSGRIHDVPNRASACKHPSHMKNNRPVGAADELFESNNIDKALWINCVREVSLTRGC